MEDAVVEECAVCVSPVSAAKRFACPGCGYVVCKACQQEYRQPSCMSCRVELTRSFMLSTMGRTYVDTVLRSHIEKGFLDRERALLPDAQQSVDRIRDARATADLARFVVPARTRLVPSQSVTSPTRVPQLATHCPRTGCRGFIRSSAPTASSASDRGSQPPPGVCGVCAARVCGLCGEEVVEGDGHRCCRNTLLSMHQVRQECRSCPTCSVAIMRSSGCDHMKCTFCGCNFHWVTGKIIHRTTNLHYAQVALISADFAQARLTGAVVTAGAAGAAGAADRKSVV